VDIILILIAAIVFGAVVVAALFYFNRTQGGGYGRGYGGPMPTMPASRPAPAQPAERSRREAATRANDDVDYFDETVEDFDSEEEVTFGDIGVNDAVPAPAPPPQYVAPEAPGPEPDRTILEDSGGVIAPQAPAPQAPRQDQPAPMPGAAPPPVPAAPAPAFGGATGGAAPPEPKPEAEPEEAEVSFDLEASQPLEEKKEEAAEAPAETSSGTTIMSPGSGPVQFSAYHPKTVQAGDWHPLYAYVFRDTAASAVVGDAFQRLGEKQAGYSGITQPARAEVKEGAAITATPDLPGFQFNPLTVTMGFYDDWARFDFQLRARDAALNQFATGRITFTIEGVIVADVPLSVYVGESGGDVEINSAVARAYQAIFCSYSHDDAAIVERVERAYKALGLDYLRDVTTLRSGSDWNAALLKLIDKADIFQLFWSESAAESPYVKQEYEHALKYEGERPGFIRPVWWKEPMAAVPDALSHIHFAYEPGLDD
jgi:hypothetical protein